MTTTSNQTNSGNAATGRTRSTLNKSTSIVWLASLMFWAGHATAATINVPAQYATIQAAINAASPGDTVQVAAGTYAGNITITKSLTVMGDPGDASAGPGPNAPVIDGGSASGDGFLIANGVTNVTIAGFEVRNFTSGDTGIGNGVSAWVGSTTNITVTDNYFHNLGWNGVLVGNDKSATPGKWGDHVNWTIKNNVLETFEAYGFELTNTKESSISNNIIHANATWDLPATCIMADARRNESGIVIRGNQLDGEMWPGYPAVYVFANSFETPNVNLTNVLIEANVITTTSSTATPQVTIYNYPGSGTVTGVQVHRNSFNTLRNGTPAAVNATCNWWGTVDATAIASQIIGGNVTYSPWLGFTPGTSPMTLILNTNGTIQSAIDAAAAGDTINVLAGYYTNNMVINKPLTLTGAGQGSSIVYPATSNPNCGGGGGGSLCAGAANIVLVQADNVTLSGFTLNGDNPGLTSGVVAGGADIDARNGIITDHTLGVFNNLTVHHVTVANIYLRGIYASSGGSFDFHDNIVGNVQADPSSIGIFNFGGSGVIACNTVSDCGDAISANWSTGTQFKSNTVLRCASGIHTDNNGGSGGAPDLIQGNVVRDGPMGAYGVWVFVPYGAVTVSGNTISNVSVGLALFGQGAPAGSAAFTDNTEIGNNDPYGAGVFVGGLAAFGGIYGSANVSASFTGNTVSNNVTGLDLEPDPGYSENTGITNNVVTGNSLGAYIAGAGAAVHFQGNSIVNNTSALTTPSGTTYLDAGNTVNGDITGDLYLQNATLTADSHNLASCVLTVGPNGLLAGNGRVGNLVLNSGATLAPGASPGEIDVATNVTWAGGAEYDWQINKANGSKGADPGWDWLNITNALTITANGGNQFNVKLITLTLGDVAGSMAGFDCTADYSWTIATAGGGVSGFAANAFNLDTSGFANPIFGGTFAIANAGNDINLTFTHNSTPQAVVYVDDGYVGKANGTLVKFPDGGGGADHAIGFDAFATVQAAINAVSVNGTINVAAGAYGENVAVTKPVTLLGANQGVAGCGGRGTESSINGGAGIALDIQSTNVTVDGFALTGAVGLRDSGYVGVAVRNNAVTAAAIGMIVTNITTTVSSGVTVNQNCITLTSQLAGATPTVGLGVTAVSGPQAPSITTNSISGAFYGYALYKLNATPATVVQGGTVTGALVGLGVFNVDPGGSGAYNPSSFAVDGVNMSGFTGSYPGTFHAGLYVFTGGGNTAAKITGAVSNLTITGTGKISPDSAAVYLGDFSTNAGVRQSITVQNCIFTNNLNRGVSVRGSNALVSVSQCRICGNGSDPYGTGGNDGFGVIIQLGATGTVSQCFIANPATVSNPYHVYALASFGPPTGSMTVNNCSLTNNGNASGLLARVLSASVDASGDWWGTNGAAGVAALIGANVDYTPWLDVGTDTDPATAGFQGDFHTLDVAAASPQTGTSGRIQEAVDLVSGSTVNVAAGTYVEDLLIDKPLILLGPNANINPNTGIRVPEAVIVPLTSDPDPNTGGQVIYVATNNVTIKGFTVDGDNPNTTSGITLRGADLDAVEGISGYDGVGSITIANNIIKNTSYSGIDFYNYYNNGGATTDNYIQGNKFQNIGYVPYGFGFGVLLYNNFYADVSGNVMTDVRLGVQTGNFSQSNPGTTQNINSNTITSTRIGIWHNLQYSGASTFTISGNTLAVEDETGASRWNGIMLSTIQSSVGAVVTSNTISATPVTQTTAGYQVWSDPTTLGIKICGGSVSGAGYGVWLNNYDGYTSDGDATTLTVNGVTIAGSTLAGIYVKDNAASTHKALLAVVTNNCTISSAVPGAVGVLVEGAAAKAAVKNNTASITGNAYGIEVTAGSALIQSNNLTGNTIAGIRVENGATVDAGNCSGVNITGLGISTGGNDLSGYGFDNAAPWAITNANSSAQTNVLADHNNFGAGAGQDIGAVLYDHNDNAAYSTVVFSQLPQVLTCPPTVNVVCSNDVPAGVTSLPSFIALGGSFSASAATVSFSDTPHPVGNGSITRTYTVTDACGVFSQCNQTINVSDTTPPTPACPANIVANADAGHCSKSNVTWTATATDDCTVTNIVSMPPSGSTFAVGTNTVTVTATDAAGNTNSCSFTVTINDTQAPNITCPAGVTVNVLQAKDPYFTGTATASDNCGSVTVTYEDDPNGLTNCDATGVIYRTWTAVDAHNNTNTCLQLVTVIDTNLPVVVCPANIVTNAASGLCSQIVTFAPTAKDAGYLQDFEDPNFVSDTTGNSLDWHDGNSHLSRVPSGTDGITSSSGSAHGVIDSTVPAAGPAYSNSGAYTFEDGINSAFGSGYRVALNIYVNLLDPAVTGATATTGYAWDLSTSASDASGNFLRDFIFHTAAYGPTGIVVAADNNSNFGRRNDLLTLANHAVLTNTGWYTFEWVMRNTNGVLAVDLNVRDASGALLFRETSSNPTDVIGNVGGNPYYTWFIFVDDDKLAIDDSTFEHILPVTSSPASGSTFAVGTTTVTNTATDACGNSNVCTFTVTVTDTQMPGITCPADIVAGADAGHCSRSNVTWSVTASDNCGSVTVVSTPASGSTFAVGTTTVTNVATDSHGNTNVCTFTVTINDTEAPSITVPANITVNAAPDVCSSNVTFTVSASDNCANNTLVSVPASGFDFPVGVTTVTNVATDIHGNASTNYFTVTVIDTQPPSITVPANITVNAAPGVCSSNVTFTVSASDNCANNTLVSAPASGFDFPVGVTTVTNVATDIHGNASTNYFTVTVIDTQPPSITVPANITVNAAPGVCSSNVTFTVSASDNCANNTLVSAPASGFDFPVGVTTVTNVATDIHGNASTNYFTVTVIDTQPPSITCPANIVASADAGHCSRTNVTWSVTASDNCGSVNLVSTPASGSTFAVGTTTVTNVATDSHGNTNVCTFTVTINDTEAPDITCPANIVASADAGHCSRTNVTWSVTASDNCGSVNLVSTPASGSTFAVGTTTVTNVATDSHGNTNVCTFTVTINDTEAPDITCPANIVASADAGHCSRTNVTWSVTASDNCGSVNLVSTPASGSTFAVGTTTVTNVATDSHGNTNVCTFTVTINDTEAPDITCPANIVASADAGHCSRTNVTWSVTASDNCGSVNLVSTPASGSTFAVGTTTVTNVATDSHGNTNVCTFTVTINDTEAPDITCPANIVASADAGHCSRTNVTWSVTASDNCGSVNLVSTPASGSTFAVGTTTVTNVATDSHGNTNVCTFTVTINDTQPPSITCPISVTNTTAPGLCYATNLNLGSPTTADNCGVASVTNNAFSQAPAGHYSLGATIVSWTVVDVNDNTNTCLQTVVVQCPTIPLNPSSLAAGTVGSAYSQSITASGGAAPYSYTNTSGSLPAGLTLDSGGLLHGTPTAAGVANFTVTATDACGCTGNRSYSVTNTCPTITVGPATLPNPTLGSNYNQTVSASGGTAAYTYAVTSGGLPAGLTLDGSGLLHGIPTAGGVTNFTVTATDIYQCSGSTNYTLAPACPTLTLSPALLPNAQATSNYSQTITASGALGTFAFGVTSGALPGGMTLSSGGVLSGTPTGVGSYSFTVTATNSNGGCTGSGSYKLNVITPFPLDNPTWYGLFQNTNGPQSRHTDGFIVISKVLNKESFTGKLYLDGQIVNLVGNFDTNGNGLIAIMVVPRLFKPALLLTLQADIGFDTISGVISNPVEGWQSTVVGDKYVFGTSPASQLQGSYTMVLPGSNGANLPGGAGGARITIQANGMVLVQLAYTGDGQAFIPYSAPVSKDGHYPLFAHMYGLQGVLMGWVNFTPTASPPAATFSGDLHWEKPNTAPPAGTYNAGFTNDIALVGSGYDANAPGSDHGIFIASGVVTVTGGSLVLPLTNTCIIGGGIVTMNAPVTHLMKLGYATAFSTLGLQFSAPLPLPASPLTLGRGWYLQSQNYGDGWFKAPGANVTGDFQLH